MNKEEIKAARIELREELKQELVGIRVQLLCPIRPVLFNWQGIQHCLSKTSIEPLRQFHALRQLPDLLHQAQYAHFKPDNHIPPRKGVGVHILYATCELDEQAYQVWLRVRETPDGLYFYDLGVVR